MRFSQPHEIGRFLLFVLASSVYCNHYSCATKEMNLVHTFSNRCMRMAGARRHYPSVFNRKSPQTIIPAFANLGVSSTSANLQNGSSEKIIYCHDQAPEQNSHRRRRGAMHSFQRKMVSPLMATPLDESTSSTTTKITQYTINDSICPPTDPDVLKKTVIKHIQTLPKYWESRPIAKHTAAAFEEALQFVIDHGEQSSSSLRTKVILDSGCGTGKSSILLGERYPDCVVIGVDQSLARLSKNKSFNQNENDDDDSYTTQQQEKRSNVLLLRAELSDFWKCCLSSSQWQHHVHIHKHYLLYPNPYPKKSRLKSRFYAHPAFPLLMMTLMMEGEEGEDVNIRMQSNIDDGKEEKLVVRSNWKGYLEEFKSAVDVWREYYQGNDLMDFSEKHDGWQARMIPVELETVGPKRLDIVEPLTNFEAKYIQCGEPIYELSVLKTMQE